MIELETPQQPQPAPTPRIDEVEADGNMSRFEVTPLQEGYGVTLGNALRRVLLSSLEGAAVTSIQISGVFHEFSTIENVKEDVTQIVLNIKKLRLRSFARHPITLKLVKRGAGPVTAGDIAESADVEIVNPDLVLLTLDSDSGSIEMDLTIETGMGYRPAEHTEEMPIGVVPVDAHLLPGSPRELHGREDPRRADDELRQALDRDRDRRHHDRAGGAERRRPTSSSASSAGSPRSVARRSAGRRRRADRAEREPARRPDRGARPPDAGLQQPEAQQHHEDRPGALALATTSSCACATSARRASTS